MIYVDKAGGKGFDYPGRDIKLSWDKENMKVTNFDDSKSICKT